MSQTVLSAEQVRTLAPDAAAARAGEALASPKRWTETGRSESAAWGLCQGSGSSPYQVAVDLAGPAYRCSCPSRKIPCKHALGLLFVLAAGEIATGTPPDWASAWIESRASRGATAATRKDGAAEADPAARARRVEAREKKVAAGIEELDRWLGDLMRRGLDSSRSEGYRFWDSMGARLVDAQAAGLGRAVRGLGSAANAGDAWPTVLLEGAARLHLLCEAYRRLDELPQGLRSDVRSLVGWTTKEEDLEQLEGVEDRWLVVGRRLDDSGQVMTARTWLLGETSGRFAMHLAFGVEQAPPTVLAWPGQAFRATLSYYPSATPLRAAVRPVLVPDGGVTSLPHGSSIAAALAANAERLAANPFIDAWPVVLDGVVPVLRGEAVLVRHPEGTALPVAPASVAPRLLAVSGGRPMTLVAEWNGAAIRPISAFAEGRLVDLDGPEGAFLPPRTAASNWPQLVSAALLGTERTGELALSADGQVGDLIASSHAGDPERRLMAAAGVVALRARAGRRSGTDASDLPEPAPADPRPALGPGPARLLRAVLAEYHEQLEEYLELLQTSGRRLPDEHLPELIGAARSNLVLRQAVAQLGGPRATWLAAQVPALRDVVITEPSAGPEETWGAAKGPKERGLAIRAIRGRDPAGGRELVEARLDEIAGDERAAAVAALEVGLSSPDEAFLEGRLEDRRADVRRVAAELLSRLEGSAFARRLAERARPMLGNQGLLRSSLAVALPTIDSELEAAGFAGKPPEGIGERAWLLRLVVAHVPPKRWMEWLRAQPSALIERALRADEARPILEGWIDATGRFGDAAWAAALLAEPKVRGAAEGVDVARVLDALPPAEVVRIVAASAGLVDLAMLPRLVDRCPVPWPPELVEAVFGILATSAGSDAPDPAYFALIRRAAAAVPPARADDLEALASHRGQIRPSVTAAMDTVEFRRLMHAAFADLRRPT